MRIFAKLVSKVETALLIIQRVSYHFGAVGAPNNHDIAMVIVL